MSGPAFALNPDLDIDRYAAVYREQGLVQIPDIFTPETARAVRDLLAGAMPWRLLFTDENDRPVHYTGVDWNGLPQADRTRMMQDVHARARQNRGFLYYTWPMIEAYLRGWDKGHPLHAMTELINSPAFLDIGRALTGLPGIAKADAHACQYRPGHFLTRHLDYGEDRERRAAYVLGFTEGWQPDWGGLLLFLKDNQDVEKGFLPRFNNLTVFDVKYLHTVTQVSNFAGAPRLTITGWFRDDPVAEAAGS